MRLETRMETTDMKAFVIEHKSLRKFIEENANLQLSEDGQYLEIIVRKGRKTVLLAGCHLDSVFDAEGNYFERDV